MPATRILVVDDSVTIRAMLEQVLGREHDFELVGTAGDAAEALEMIDAFRPHVTTLDIVMPGLDGLELLDMIHLQTHAIMLTSRRETAKDAMARGAFGFFEKTQILRNPKRLVNMVRRAAEGRPTRFREPTPALAA